MLCLTDAEAAEAALVKGASSVEDLCERIGIIWTEIVFDKASV